MRSERPRDSQRGRVYSWETTIVDEALRTQLTLEECRALIAEALKRYQPAIEIPLVVDGRNGRRAWTIIGKNKISLPVWARTPCVVLHEVSHLLTPLDAASHGPEFVRIMCHLWKWHAGKNYTASAKKWGIQLAHPKSAPKPIAI